MEPDSTEQDQQKNKSNWLGLKRFTKKNLFFLLVPVFVILAVLLFLIINIYHTPDLNELFARAKLAKLPELIQNLQFETRPVMDNDPGEPKECNLFVRFQAKPNDIDNFIKSSPGIEKNHFLPLHTMPDNDEAPT